MNTDTKSLDRKVYFISFLKRLAFFTGGWFIFLGGPELGDLWLAILIIIITTVASILAVPPRQWVLSPLGLALFFPYFIIASLRGGWNVGRRVFFKTVSVDPTFLTIEHDRHPQKTLVLAWVISMLPGTVSCQIKDGTIEVHVLDKNLPVVEDIEDLKIRINGIFAKRTH